MTIETADALTEYLIPEIQQGLASAKQARDAVKFKQCGLDYIQACKDVSTTNGVLDADTLKGKILSAVALLQAYHDAL
jgi:hypothetical protein